MIKDLIKLANNLDSKGLYKEADALDKVISKVFEKVAGLSQEEELAWKALHSEAWEVYGTRDPFGYPLGHGREYIKHPDDSESIELISRELATSWYRSPEAMNEAVLAWHNGTAKEYLESKGERVSEDHRSEDHSNLFKALVWVAVENEMFNYLESRPTSEEMNYRDYEERVFGPPASDEDYESDLPRREY